MKKNICLGFTLIELLAVIMILGIILSITIPNVLNVISNATKSTFKIDVRELITTISNKRLSNVYFDPTTVNEENLRVLTGLYSSNYESITVTFENEVISIIVVGTNKWEGLIACGNFDNLKVVTNLTECNPI
jgi:prepilin-type N-terminal cleavage/methylation domain-containing protein